MKNHDDEETRNIKDDLTAHEKRMFKLVHDALNICRRYLNSLMVSYV